MTFPLVESVRGMTSLPRRKKRREHALESYREAIRCGRDCRSHCGVIEPCGRTLLSVMPAAHRRRFTFPKQFTERANWQRDSFADRSVAPFGHANFQRVDLLWKYFSHRPKTTCGRTANTGSFIDRMSSFIDDMSNLYLRSYWARNLRRAATSAISATPSTITASLRVLGANHAFRVARQIPRLARLAASAEEQASVLPQTPDDHRVRRAVWL